MKVLLSPVIVALLLGASAVGATQSDPQTGTRLNPKIPPPVEAQYRAISDAKDWRNPKVFVGADAITVESRSLADGRKATSATDLRDLLISLPVTDWPYGRVVGAQDPSIRSGSRSEDAAITRNHTTAEQVLRELDIRANWWPPAPALTFDQAPHRNTRAALRRWED